MTNVANRHSTCLRFGRIVPFLCDPMTFPSWPNRSCQRQITVLGLSGSPHGLGGAVAVRGAIGPKKKTSSWS
jgi:hypothetical protein